MYKFMLNSYFGVYGLWRTYDGYVQRLSCHGVGYAVSDMRFRKSVTTHQGYGSYRDNKKCDWSAWAVCVFSDKFLMPVEIAVTAVLMCVL